MRHVHFLLVQFPDSFNELDDVLLLNVLEDPAHEKSALRRAGGNPILWRAEEHVLVLHQEPPDLLLQLLGLILVHEVHLKDLDGELGEPLFLRFVLEAQELDRWPDREVKVLPFSQRYHVSHLLSSPLDIVHFIQDGQSYIRSFVIGPVGLVESYRKITASLV